MKKLTSAVVVLILIFGWSLQGTAQTVQYVTVTGATGSGNNLPVQTNQIVSVVGYDWFAHPTISGQFQTGININLTPYNSMTSQSAFQSQIPQIFTGLTNISVQETLVSYPGATTFQITTPATTTVISN
jgi:hypothetical protein